MLALETKQSGGKLLPHSDLRGGGSVSRGNIAQRTKRDENRYVGFVLLTQYCAGDKIEKNEMGWACGAYGWGEEGV